MRFTLLLMSAFGSLTFGAHECKETRTGIYCESLWRRLYWKLYTTFASSLEDVTPDWSARSNIRTLSLVDSHFEKFECDSFPPNVVRFSGISSMVGKMSMCNFLWKNCAAVIQKIKSTDCQVWEDTPNPLTRTLSLLQNDDLAKIYTAGPPEWVWILGLIASLLIFVGTIYVISSEAFLRPITDLCLSCLRCCYRV